MAGIGTGSRMIAMKKRILFVDDEAEVLAQLERDLAALSTPWEAAFAASGNEAIERLRSSAFDVVVADMHMPGMTGADLLNRVGQEHPGTLRFIRSSFADKELMMTCVWGHHHFIPKPVAASELVSTLQRALALDAWMGTDRVKALVAKVQNFPSLPSVYFEVVKHLESPNASVDQIADAIAKDLAMTAKLLQMVNSAFFGLPEKITSPSHAILTLGMETVRSILLCIQVYSKADQTKASRLSLDSLWAHSLAVGTAAKRITLHQTGDAKAADEAFTAGLLHDIGKLILSSNLGDAYNAVLNASTTGEEPLWAVEERELGASHADVGAYLLGLWSMPVPLLEAAAFHHHPERGATREFCATIAVHAANAFLREKQTRPGDKTVPGLNLEFLASLGLADRVDAWRLVAEGKPAPRPQLAPEAKTGAVSAPPPPVPANGRPAPWWLWIGAPVAASVALVLILSQFAEKPGSRPARPTTFAAATPEKPSPPTPQPAAAVATPAEPDKSPVAEPVLVEPAPVHQKPVSLATPPASIPVAPAPPVAKPIDYRLQGIFFGSKRPSATINGRLVFAGDLVSGAEVVSIGRSNVLLSVHGEPRELTLR